MGQDFYVVRCYSCEAFQVHQMRKDKKFVCKICGSKQSVKKTYGEGSGKDCRLHVQKLNEHRCSLDAKKEEEIEDHLSSFVNDDHIGIYDLNEEFHEKSIEVPSRKRSKWDQYLDSDDDEDTSGNTVKLEKVDYSSLSDNKAAPISTKEQKEAAEMVLFPSDEINNEVKSTSSLNKFGNFQNTFSFSSGVNVKHASFSSKPVIKTSENPKEIKILNSIPRFKCELNEGPLNLKGINTLACSQMEKSSYKNENFKTQDKNVQNVFTKYASADHLDGMDTILL